MAKTIKCPACGNEGRADASDGRFEARGQYRGAAIRRCCSCGAGLSIGLFTGGLFGNPKRIPSEQWEQMQAVWSENFSEQPSGSFKAWDQLSDRQKEQLRLMMVSLEEFSYGFQRAFGAASSEDGSSASRFYSHALYQYCASYFTAPENDKDNLKDRLRALGSGDLVEDIEKLLDTELGETTFGCIVRRYRNRFLVHQRFRLSEMDKITDKFDLSVEENAMTFSAHVKLLFQLTQELHVALLNRFPSAT